MAYAEEEALLRMEEGFSRSLGRVNRHGLQPLLSAGPEPWAAESAKLLLQLLRGSQRLWEVTQASLQSLRERLRPASSASLESLLLLRDTDRVQRAYTEYIQAYESCMVAPAFLKTAESKRELWRLCGMPRELQLPEHLQDYRRLLRGLSASIGERHGAWQLAVRAPVLLEGLQLYLAEALDRAEATQALWRSLRSPPRDLLFTSARRLLHDSQDAPVTVSGLRGTRVLLFDDALVLLQGHRIRCTFDLRLVWVMPGTDGCTFHLLMPEKELCLRARAPLDRTIWQRKVVQAVCGALRGKKDLPVLGTAPECPDSRSAVYTFRGPGRLCQATYEGEWRRARPHGRGTLKWPDGRNHAGGFQEGVEHGFGVYLVPRGSEDKFDCYKCHWRKGSLSGYGVCEYGAEEVYQGYFQDGLWHGFGVLDRARHAPQPLRYTGHWERGQRSGYGVQEDKDSGKRYIGLWQAGERHGPGLVVSRAGDCYQGTFQGGKPAGPGVLLTEDDTVYEGTFSPDLALEGKGKVTFPGGTTLEGSFSSRTGKGLHTQGVLDTAAPELHPSSAGQRQLGLGAFPQDGRWPGVLGPFWDFVRAGCPGDLQEALLGFHGHPDSERKRPEERWASLDQALAELPRPQEPEALQAYLKRALSDHSHPLGKLLRTLTLTFQATYAGIGANKHLQGLALGEVERHAHALWAAYRGLLGVALRRKGQDLEEEEDAETRGRVHGLMLPLVLPSVYPELSTLYLLLHEQGDSLYQQGLAGLGPDSPGLHSPLPTQWPSLAKDQSLLSAAECLQKIMTTVDPREKLEVLEQTHREIEDAASQARGPEHRLSMDDLLPLLIFVVSRAHIQHLGAEIHLLRDLMYPSRRGGLHDFLLTALESCYEQIQREARPRRLPRLWHSREHQ